MFRTARKSKSVLVLDIDNVVTTPKGSEGPCEREMADLSAIRSFRMSRSAVGRAAIVSLQAAA